jgi:hypothetical protein
LTPATAEGRSVEGPDVTPGTDDEPESRARITYLLEHPDDAEAWGRELEHLRNIGDFIATMLAVQSSPTLRMADCNNRMLIGNALRHLKRYEEALDQLRQTERSLGGLFDELACDASRPDPLCADVREHLAMTSSFVADIWIARDEPNQVGRALKRAAEVSAKTDGHSLHVRQLVVWQIHHEQTGEAARTVLNEVGAEDRAAGDRAVRESAARLAEGFYGAVFDSISWRPGKDSEVSRDADPRDFFDMYGIGIGRSVKYGMTDSDEDSATFKTVFFVQELMRASPNEDWLSGYSSMDEMRKNYDIDAYVRQQMSQGNFEPAAKYVYVRYVDGRFGAIEDGSVACRPAEEGWITFDDLRDQLEAVPALGVPPSTMQAIEAFDNAYSYLESRCRAAGSRGARDGKKQKASSNG